MGPLQPTVYIIDDEQPVCDTLALLLRSVALAPKCFQFARDFLASVRPEHHGCIILDLRMPGISGLEVQDKLTASGVSMPVILLTGHADVSIATRAMKAGAFDLIEKPFNAQVLLDCVWRAIEADYQRKVQIDQANRVRERMGRLSKRERDVLEMVVAGTITKQIAANLGLSSKTVDNHRARIMDKTQAGSVADLVRMYYAARGDLQISVPDRHAGQVTC